MVINSFHNVKVEHEKFGVVLNETFIDGTQFKIFLKAIHGCLTLKEDLTFFNGTDFLVHVPYKHLVDSIISTGKTEYTSSDHVKSKIEALVTK